MDDLVVMNEIICTCGKCIFEADANYCSGCGDVMCKDCYTDCFSCGKMFCVNCSQSYTRCIKCDYNMALPKITEKAFLILDGKVNVAIPIKNSAFMIQKTSIANAREITLELTGDKYKFSYRQTANEEGKTDYFLYFDKIEIEPTLTKDTIERIRQVYNSYMADGDYDDYGNPWLGW